MCGRFTDYRYCTDDTFWQERHMTNYSFWALISGVFSHLRRPEIRTTYYGTENHPYFLSQFLEGAKTSESPQNWRQSWAVSAASRNWDLLEFCVLLVPGMTRLTTYPICRIKPVTNTKASHLRRPPPTAYRRRFSSRTCRKHACSRRPLGSLFLWRKQEHQSILLIHKTSLKNQTPQ